MVFFLVLVASYDVARCVLMPTYLQLAASLQEPGSIKWYMEMFTPNFILLLFCIPKLYIMKKFSSSGESGVWNPIFYFAFAIVVTATVLVTIEIFDTDIEIIQNA